MSSTILIVEDEWLIADDYAETLSEAGHTIVGPCGSVGAAIATIDGHAIDAALLDMELSGEKTFAVAERLQARSIPFAFISGHSSGALPTGLVGKKVLAKPVTRETLLAAVGQLVGTALPG